MLGALIKKDLARLRVNWRGLAILLAMPLAITGLIGVVFGPAARDGDMPRIKLAMVDEDQSVLGSMLTGVAANQQSAQYLDVLQVDRDEAMRLINDNQISAVVVIPASFSETYFSGERTPPIELIKNPAQSYMPAITEELLLVLAELLDAFSKHLLGPSPELAELTAEQGAPDFEALTKLAARVGDRFQRAEDYLFPPIIGLEKAELISGEEQGRAARPSFNIFAFVMPGLGAMFLLFAAEGATRDLLVEKQIKTLDRYRTFNIRLLPFLLSKSAYSLIVVLLSATIMIGGATLIFRIVWQRPLVLLLVTLAYCVFCIGFTYLLIAVISNEKLSSMLNTIVIMLMGFLGGSMIPSQNLPGFVRDTIAPWLPNYVFAEAVKRIQFSMPGPHWGVALAGLSVAGLVMLLMATLLMQRRLRRGAV